MWGLSIGHWGIVALVIILLFGRHMVSGFMADMGKAIKNARQAVKELERDPNEESRRGDRTIT